jgi:hypothetical protein
LVTFAVKVKKFRSLHNRELGVNLKQEEVPYSPYALLWRKPFTFTSLEKIHAYIFLMIALAMDAAIK